SAGVLVVAGSALVSAAGRLRPRPGRGARAFALLLGLGAISFLAALICEGLSHWQTGLRPTDSAYGAMVYMASFLNLQVIAACTILALYAIARYFAGKLDTERRVNFDN